MKLKLEDNRHEESHIIFFIIPTLYSSSLMRIPSRSNCLMFCNKKKNFLKVRGTFVKNGKTALSADSPFVGETQRSSAKSHDPSFFQALKLWDFFYVQN